MRTRTNRVMSKNSIRVYESTTPEQQNVTLIDAATLREAEPLIESRDACNPEWALIPFDNILDRVAAQIRT